MILAATTLGMAVSHTLIDGVLEQSTIYPGTVHTFQVYVPEQYDGKRPAALYVGLDGVLCNAPQVMDSLIAARQMPCTIGVFLQPGVIKGTTARCCATTAATSSTAQRATLPGFLRPRSCPLSSR